MRQDSGLGRFVRGAAAGRDGSSDADGTGALSQRSWSVFAVAVLVAIAACLAATEALASPPRYELVGKFGPDGTESSEFVNPGPVAVDQQSHVVYAAAGNLFTPGKLYKFDAEGNPLSWGGSAPYISGNEISGLELLQGERQIAVDSSTHTVYVTSANSIRAFQANGEPSEFTAGPGAGTSSIGGFVRLAGVAVDAGGYIYASDLENGVVKIFAPSGEEVNQFATEGPANLAVDSTGAVYVTRQFGPVTKFTPSSSPPVTGATTYTAASDPVDPEDSFTVGVDPATNDVYVVHLLSPDPGAAVYAEDGTPITSFGEPGSDGEVFGADGIAIDGTSTKVYVGNSPENGSGKPPQVYVFRPEPPKAPTIEVLTVSGVSSTAATLYARINPDQKATNYRFEYGPGDCAISACTTVPLGSASIGEGNDGVWVSEEIKGLSAGTEYHYRVIAENEVGSDEASRTFTTQLSGIGFQLPDHRAWEMVSPPNKHGAQLRGSQPSGGLVQAAADGNGIAYVSAGSIEAGPEGNRILEVSAVLSGRGANGWRSKDIAPPNARVTPALAGRIGEYDLFSPDLSKAILDPRSGTSLSPEASERSPYLRANTDPPVYRPLVTGKEGFANVPSGTEFGNPDGLISSVTVVDATPDLGHVVLGSDVPLVAGAPTPSIYEWADGQLEPISVLPAAEGGAIVTAKYPGSGPASMRHAISDDGSRVFWTSLDGRLYMRDMEAGETVRIDQVQPGFSGTGEPEPLFQGASADGRIVFFTDTQQLTEDSGASLDVKGKKPDLYECEIAHVGPTTECEVHDLTPKVGAEVGQVQGIVSGVSEDGSRVYFVAKGALSGEANQFGQAAVAGQPNLYLWQEGEGLRFIATLAAEDRPDWGLAATVAPPGETSKLSTASSPSGRYFAFMSERELTDQESMDVIAKEPVERVFRYDADSGRLDCISCSPGGAAPRGVVLVRMNELVDPRGEWEKHRVAASLPQAGIYNVGGETLYQPRAVLENGRTFFNAIDSLVPADSNGQWDVYEWEPTGVGDCTFSSEGASISRSAGGCVALISSGTAEEEVGFLDASETGDDVFFMTPAQLNETDEDHELDIYDARVDGVPATLPKITECLGEACQPPAQAPNDQTPASASFKGQGNLKPNPRKRCAKGKRQVRQGGKSRCMAKKQKRRHRRAPSGRGAKR
jgi:hypothetical protein